MNNVFQKFLILSLILHLLLLFFLKMPQPEAELFPKPPKLLWIDLKKKAYEIVDVLPPAEESRPKDSKFVGMYDMTAQEETVAVAQGRSEQQKQKGSAEKIPSKDQDGFGMKGADAFSEALPEDFYPNFQRGNHTYLNVLRFPDVQYFVRLKRVFKTTWNPESPLRKAAFTSKISRGTIEVVLGVSVDPKGNLAEAFIFRSSGIAPYDEEALRTIRASSPFSVPPAKLLERDGLLRMSWTFTVYL